MSNREKFLNMIRASGKETLTTAEISKICEQNNTYIPSWFMKPDNELKIKRGLYRVSDTKNSGQSPVVAESKPEIVQMAVPSVRRVISSVTTEVESDDLIPKKYANYVEFGNFSDVYDIIKSNKFFPVFLTGQSGNGKTMSIEQACAKAGRKFIVVSMTPETDEGDLLGNYVLIDGEMVWRDGPVTVAARQGAVLCIDEIDYGAQNLATLQRVLEGKPFLLKKKNEMVVPKEGFTVFATANTKGKGSDDGRYMFTNILNEAFLERFPITMEQDWAPVAIEKKIISKEIISAGREDKEFADYLVGWADVIRKSFMEGAAAEVISTRRLVHIAKTYGIFGDRMTAISLCLNRFDADTKISFLDLYTKIDDSLTPKKEEVIESTNEGTLVTNDISF